jgi:hypothetical protein
VSGNSYDNVATKVFFGGIALTQSSLRVDQLATEFHSLRTNLGKLQDSGTYPEWDAIADPIRDRMAVLTQAMIEASAQTGADLALKASVLLDWLAPMNGDMPGMLSASLCRDILLLFPAQPAAPIKADSGTDQSSPGAT